MLRNEIGWLVVLFCVHGMPRILHWFGCLRGASECNVTNVAVLCPLYAYKTAILKMASIHSMSMHLCQCIYVLMYR